MTQHRRRLHLWAHFPHSESLGLRLGGDPTSQSEICVALSQSQLPYDLQPEEKASERYFALSDIPATQVCDVADRAEALNEKDGELHHEALRSWVGSVA